MSVTITQGQGEEIAYEATDMSGFGEISFRSSYSGRGMYGKTCIGFESDEGSVNEFALGVVVSQMVEDGSLDEDVRDQMLRGASHDSMSRGTIVYFRGITCDDAGDDEDD